MESFEEKLIAAVKERDCLYNTKYRSYKNTHKRNEEWANISEELDRPVEECRQRWRSLRDRFVREKKKREQASWSGAIHVDEWDLYPSLTFLTDATRPRTKQEKELAEPSSPDFIGYESVSPDPMRTSSTTGDFPMTEFFDNIQQNINHRADTDDADPFITFLSSKLRQLPRSARLRLEGRILDLVNEEILKYEDKNLFHAQKFQNFEKMQNEDPEHFFTITRMKPETFNLLLSLVEPSLEKTSRRKPILPSCRLFLVLLYLSQGVSRQVIAWMFRIGYTTVGDIIYDTCEVLWDVLMPLYMAPPSDENWRQIAADFYRLWDLPNCVSAIDAKHINIRCPPRGSSSGSNYKDHHPMVLLAACDANYIFTVVDVGAYGNQSDGGIFAESIFGKKSLDGTLNLPPPTLLPNSNMVCDHYLAGDATFPLKTFLMRPYPGRPSEERKLHFNIMLSRANGIIENAFGVLVARWRILQTTLNMLPANADKVVKACTVLHNFAKLNDDTYCTQEYVDSYDEHDLLLTKGNWRNEAHPLQKVKSLGSNFSSQRAFGMREAIKEYLFQHKK